MLIIKKENAIDDVLLQDLKQKTGLEEIVIKLLINRGIDTIEKINNFLEPTIRNLHNPFLLHDMQKVVDIINNAVSKNKKILIFGDYDADGISATAILYKYFESLNKQADYFLPNRYEDGYGLTMDTVNKVLQDYSPELIITVDCGISCYKEIEYIKSKGIEIVVTDHHEIPEILPDCPIINAKLPNQDYPFKELCGAGVALKIVQALGEINLQKYLAIASIATIADIVPLLDENRAIVKLGIEYQSFLPLGIKCLITELNCTDLMNDIAFRIAPKINAGGRMGDASISLQLYISNNQKVIDETLIKLNEMNSKRQELCAIIYDDCVKKLQEQNQSQSRCIILKNTNWNVGLIGIVCARLTEEYNKPTFLFSSENGLLRGSVRSLAQINIHELLSSCSSLLKSFGGHSMAAGLTLYETDFDRFSEEVNNYLNNKFDSSVFIATKNYDEELLEDQITMNLVKQLDLLQPYGCQNPKPLFLTNFKYIRTTRMTNHPEHLQLIIKNNLILTAFNMGEQIQSFNYSNNIQVLYELSINVFNKKKRIRGLCKLINFIGYNMQSTNYSLGNYVKQLIKLNCVVYKDINYYDNVEELITKLCSENSFGTLVVAFTPKTVEKYLSVLNKYNFVYCIGNISPVYPNNAVVLGLNNKANLINYSNVIFLDSVLNKTYLTDFYGNIYLQQKQIINRKLFSINSTREYFGKVYNALLVNQEQFSITEFEYYKNFKVSNPNLDNISYQQFVAIIQVFAELGIMSIINDNKYQLIININTKNKLEDSTFYKKLDLLK